MGTDWGPWQASEHLMNLVGELTDRSPQVERILSQFRATPPHSDPTMWDAATVDLVIILAECFGMPTRYFSSPIIDGLSGEDLDLNIRAFALRRRLARFERGRYRLCRGRLREQLDTSTPQGYREGMRRIIGDMELELLSQTYLLTR
jgi:hypothetical protein